jgi:hypothetical protein
MEYHDLDDHHNLRALKKFLVNKGFTVVVPKEPSGMLYAHRAAATTRARSSVSRVRISPLA